MEQEDFIKIKKENFGIFIFIISQPYRVAEFIIKKIN